MHLHSLFWLALAVVTAWVLYRRVLTGPDRALPAHAAGLAVLVLAFDDAHSIPAGWIANRYALVCLFLGLLTLVQHDRWRRGGESTAAYLSALSFGLALLCGELAVSTGAYLLSYALFLDGGRWRARFLSLVPYVIIGAAWTLAYKVGGYGARDSSAYVDPVVEPFRFASVVAERAPVLLAAQWWFPPSDFYSFLSPSAARSAWWIAVLFVGVIAVALIRWLRQQPAARFFALGLVLSVLPVSAMYPSDRLLAFVGFGGAGLVALVLAGVLSGAQRSFGMRSLALALGLVHLALSPLVLYLYSANLWRIRDAESRIVSSLPTDASLADQYLLFVNAPDPYKINMPLIAHALNGHPAPGHALMLGAGVYPVHVERTDESTLVVRPAAGFLAPQGTVPAGSEELGGDFSEKYVSQVTNRMFRSDGDPLSLGQRVDLDGVIVEVTELTPDSRPAAVTFRFDKPLEDASYRWMQWQDDHFVPFTPPRVHETVAVR